jgi:hypothetical protein
VKNPTTRPITIARFSTSCECAKVDPPKVTIEPGETKDIRLILDLRPRKPDEVGRADREFAIPFLPIEESGALGPKVEIRGRVRTLLQLPPRNLDIGVVSGQWGGGLALQVKLTPLQALTKWSAIVATKGWSAHVARSFTASHEVMIEAPGSLAVGSIEAVLVLKAWPQDEGTAIVSRYTIRGQCLPDVYGSPTIVALGSTAHASNPTLIVRSGLDSDN